MRKAFAIGWGLVVSLLLADWLSNGLTPQLRISRDDPPTWRYNQSHRADMEFYNPATGQPLTDVVHWGHSGPWPWISGVQLGNGASEFCPPNPNGPPPQMWRWNWYYGAVPAWFRQYQDVTVATYSGPNIGSGAALIGTSARWAGGGTGYGVSFTKQINP